MDPKDGVTVDCPDPRIDRLESERWAPFTEAQRQLLPDKLRHIDRTSAKLRGFELQDGGSEPKLLFDALPGRDA